MFIFSKCSCAIYLMYFVRKYSSSWTNSYSISKSISLAIQIAEPESFHNIYISVCEEYTWMLFLFNCLTLIFRYFFSNIFYNPNERDGEWRRKRKRMEWKNSINMEHLIYFSYCCKKWNRILENENLREKM